MRLSYTELFFGWPKNTRGKRKIDIKMYFISTGELWGEKYKVIVACLTRHL